MTDREEGADALALGAELSERLGLRLVLAHAIAGIDGMDDADGSESVTMKAHRQGAERRLARLAAQHGVAHRAEKRIGVGEAPTLLARIAAEEAADVIVVGGRARGWRRRLDSQLAAELETETPVPVLIAPPRTRQGAVNGGRR